MAPPEAVLTGGESPVGLPVSDYLPNMDPDPELPEHLQEHKGAQPERSSFAT